jgi:hypothetical protein
MCILHFTHIPKTAGTSFVKSYLEPNFGDRYFHPEGFKEFAISKYPKSSCIHGHFPFGMHYLKPLRKQDYIIFFREPVERTRSHYYFVLQDQNHYDYNRLKNHSIEEVFIDKHKPHFFSALQSNLQTKFTAGIFFGFSGLFSDKQILSIAKQNLKRKYKGIGIQEEFEESCMRFEETFGWHSKKIEKHYRKTHTKKNLDSRTITVIQNHNQLDLELYEFVKKNYFPKIY